MIKKSLLKLEGEQIYSPKKGLINKHQNPISKKKMRKKISLHLSC
jgi:hypothetical protein